MDNLLPINQQKLRSYFTIREGETRLGQRIQTFKAGFDIQDNAFKSARFVLLGIPEDIGVRANGGRAGTAGFWEAFLKVFLNIQSNHFLDGDNILLAGEVRCSDLMDLSNGKIQPPVAPAGNDALMTELDERVSHVLEPFFKHGKIPIVIGGGHNNAYPLIKACNAATGKKVQVINIDPHADFRSTADKKHSGNGFSRAFEAGYLHSYLQVGLHESYNNRHILEQYRNAGENRMQYFTYDDFLKGFWTIADIETVLAGPFGQQPLGFELDTDSIEHFPSSAQTPSGFSTAQIRQLTMMMAGKTPAYFHLPEAIPSEAPFNSMKMAAYLVSDFIKNHGR